MKSNTYMRKYSFLLISLLFIQLIAPSPAGSSDLVKVGVYQNAPLTFVDETGNIKGFFIDILEHIASKKGWEIEYVHSSLPESLSNLEKGNIDLLGGVAFSEIRGRNFDYTFESIITNWGQMYLNKKSDIESIVDLEGKKIAVLQDDIYFNNLRKMVDQFGIQCRFIEVFEYEEVLELVEMGRCDAGLVSQIYGLQRERDYDIIKSSILLSPQQLYWAAPKGKNQELLHSLDSYLRTLKKNQQSIYYEALSKWFGIGEKSKFQKWFKWIISSFVVILILFFTVSLILRVQVKTKTNELLISNEELKKEIKYRKQALERTERLNRLNERLLGSGSLKDKLRLITDEIVKIFEADFARIWMIKPGDLCDSECQHAKITEGPHVCRYRERCLHLLASSGRYTHIDGGHQRVPFGCYKIGRIAAEDKQKFLTNDVINDPRIHDHEWARKLGLVSFAGHRLLLADGGVVGVLALFSKQVVSSQEDVHLESIAGTTSQVIQTTMADEAMRESEERYSAVIQQASEGIYLLDPDTKTILEANRSFQDLLGYNPKEISELDIYDFLTHDKKDIDTNIHKIVSKKHYFVGERKYRHKDGTALDFEARANLISFGGRNVLCVVVRDITKYKRIQEEKTQLEVQLQRAEKMEAIGTLAGGVAHDLNNILSGIVSYPELLLMDLPQDSPFKKPLLTIQKSGEKAAAIVQDLLTLARRGVAVKEVVNLNHIISEYFKSPEYEKLISFHPKTQIETLIEDDILKIEGSSVHLAKTIMNLVSNAAEAMLNEGKVTISTKNQYIDRPIRGYDEIKEGDYVVLNVADNGIGISPEDLERIFEPFYTKKAMGRSGTGLGMAVVWGTVKDHDGYIDVESTEGKGTTFTLYFPVTRKELTKDELLLSLEDYIGNGESILVIDDVEEQREIAYVMLKKLGYTVTSISSGEEAVEYMKNNSADLLVLDMIMEPGINGRETYERIIKFHPDQKAIIASGFSETDEVKKAQVLGAGQYVKKPYALEKIGIAVRNELEK